MRGPSEHPPTPTALGLGGATGLGGDPARGAT